MIHNSNPTWAFEVTSGEISVSKNVLQGDLVVVKMCDFDLVRMVYMGSTKRNLIKLK